MSRRRILVFVPPHPDAAPVLAEAFRKTSLAAELAAANDLPLGAIQEGCYEAAVCWAGEPGDLALVGRIRAAAPPTRVFVVAAGADEEFRLLASTMGASFVLRGMNSPAMLVRQIERLIDSDPFEKRTRRAPLPLLISDDPAEAAKLEKAFLQAGLLAPLPVLQSSEEAIDYLSGSAPFSDRERHPLPSLILLDFHGPRGAGLGLLGWIRRQDQLRHLPVIMLSASADREDIRNAYGLQANSYLIKPGNDAELIEMVKAIKLYWSSLNIGPT